MGGGGEEQGGGGWALREISLIRQRQQGGSSSTKELSSQPGDQQGWEGGTLRGPARGREAGAGVRPQKG